MVEAERLAEEYLSETIAVQSIRCFEALKEAQALNDTTAIKVLEPMAVNYAKLVLDEEPGKKKKGRK